MFRIFCFLMLFVAGQATAYTWEDLIPAQKDLQVYGNAGLHASSTGSLQPDSIQAQWAWSRVGAVYEQQSIGSLHVFRFVGEAEVAEPKCNLAYAEQVWNFEQFGLTVKGGQFRNRALASFPAPVDMAFLRLPDASRRFTPYTAGLALSGQTETSLGQWTAEVAIFDRPRQEKVDSMFIDYDQLESSIKWAYHASLNHSWAKLEVGWEQDVGHLVTMSAAPFDWLQPRLGWSYYFHRHEQKLPDNLFFVENTAWMTPIPIGLSTRLDFGEQQENLQAGLVWEYMSNCLLECFWETRTESVQVGLTYSATW